MFVVILLAFSLIGVSEWTTFEPPAAVEVTDASSPSEADEAAVAWVHAAGEPGTSEIALTQPATDGIRSSPDLGRVFRPPRLLGS